MPGVRADATTKPRPVRGFVVFKWLVYTLLAGNVLLYAWHGTRVETIDTAAWVALLLLFEWETGGWTMLARHRLLAHAVRIPAAIAVAWACVAYARDEAWLDFANAAAWVGVIIALELELRVQPGWRQVHRVRRGVAWALYVALGALAVTWLLLGLQETEGAWLDAWDAMLWLAAFVVIELNVFGFAHRPDGAR